MLLAAPPKHGRFLALALAGMFTASACSLVQGEPLAVVPPTPHQRATPPPVITVRTEPLVVGEPRTEARGSIGRPPAGPGVTVVQLDPRPGPGPFDIDLYQEGDFVHQATKDWCVAGSVATMMNIISEGDPRNGVRWQRQLYLKGRKLSPWKQKLGPIGVDLIGWAELLNTNGFGPYEVYAANTLRAAVYKAAKALRKTGRPVGLVTWRGAHSWVMSGFRSTADPAFDPGFRVNKVYIQDTWYPDVSTIWGPSRPPNALVPVPRLKEDYLPYARPRAKWPGRDGKYMLILPVLPPNTVVD